MHGSGGFLALAALSLALAAAPQAGERHTSRTGLFTVVLPDGWRQLTPDEALDLSRRKTAVLPDEMLTPTTAAFYPYGDVDRWVAGAFDGRCLTVQQVEGEYPADQDGIALIRTAIASAAEGRPAREMLAAAVVELGADRHPAIEAVVRQSADGRWPVVRSLLLFVPTGGVTLVLGFRTWEDDFAAAEPTFRAAAASTTFARPARGPSALGDRLLYPALVGALVGLLLLGLRRRPARPGAPTSGRP